MLSQGLPNRSVGGGWNFRDLQGRRRHDVDTLAEARSGSQREFSSAARVGSLTVEPCGVQRHKGIKVLPSGLTVCGVGK